MKFVIGCFWLCCALLLAGLPSGFSALKCKHCTDLGDDIRAQARASCEEMVRKKVSPEIVANITALNCDGILTLPRCNESVEAECGNTGLSPFFIQLTAYALNKSKVDGGLEDGARTGNQVNLYSCTSLNISGFLQYQCFEGEVIPHCREQSEYHAYVCYCNSNMCDPGQSQVLAPDSASGSDQFKRGQSGSKPKGGPNGNDGGESSGSQIVAWLPIPVGLGVLSMGLPRF